jgi:hypothetical protein
MLYGDPEQMENLSSRPRLEAFRSRFPIETSRGGTPRAISSENSAESHLAASRNDDGLFVKQGRRLPSRRAASASLPSL